VDLKILVNKMGKGRNYRILNSKFKKMQKQIASDNLSRRKIILKSLLKKKLLSMRELTSFLKQVDKGQDFVTFGKIGNFKYIVVADGHGGNKTIFRLRQLNWASILSFDNFADLIFAEITALGNTSTDGATLTIIKIFDGPDAHIDVYWAGDSSAKIYKDGQEIYRTNDHDINNSEEMERMKSRGINIKNCDKLCAKTSNVITQLHSAYFYFTEYDRINMTHSIGHNNVTGKFLSHDRIPIERSPDGKSPNEKSLYKVVVGSDGFWDMMCPDDIHFIAEQSNTASILGNLALTRWNKKWHFIRDAFNGKPAVNVLNQSLGLGDDVSVGCFVGLF